MKPVYSNITPKSGVQIAGLASIDVVPREWLAVNPAVNFSTGKIISSVALLPGKSWISLQFTQDSYSFEQKPKSNKSGSFYEQSFIGTTNDLDASVQQVFETLRYHELVARIRDRQSRYRLVGTRDAGMILQVTDRENNTQAGSKILTVDMIMEAEGLAPFYDYVSSGSLGISPVFLSALSNNSISGDVDSLLNYYSGSVATTITEVYNLIVQEATEAVLNIAIANNAGLQKSEYLVQVDLSSQQAFINTLNNWLLVNGNGQSLQLSGYELRLVDPTATNAYLGIAIPKNLFGDNDIILLADDNILLLAD